MNKTTEPSRLHSRPQSPRFFFSAKRSSLVEAITGCPKSQTFGNFFLHICSCTETNPEGGERSIECVFSVDKSFFEEVLRKRKKEKMAALNAVWLRTQLQDCLIFYNGLRCAFNLWWAVSSYSIKWRSSKSEPEYSC